MADGRRERNCGDCSRRRHGLFNVPRYADVNQEEPMDELEQSGHDDRHTAASNGKQNFARYMIGGLCLILFLALTGVGYVQVEERRGGGLRPFVSAATTIGKSAVMHRKASVVWNVIGPKKAKRTGTITRGFSSRRWSRRRIACGATTGKQKSSPSPITPRRLNSPGHSTIFSATSSKGLRS